MELRYIRYFVCLAEELHFGRAAERLHITQPVLSIQIKNLEETLGGQLFIRDRRNVALTEAGSALLDKAKTLLRQSEDLSDYASMLFKGTAGRINISYSGLSAYTGIMGEMIGRFRKKYPEILINLEELTPYSQLSKLQNGSVHISFITTLGINLPTTINTAFITSSPLKIILPPNHPLNNKTKLTNQDLRNEPFVIYATDDAPGTEVIETLCGFSPVVTHRTSTALLVPSLVSAGMGIAIIPTAFAKIAHDTGAQLRELDNNSLQMDVSLAWKSGNIPPIVKNFIQLLNAEIHS
ncbi:LysR substrate-binding domain-containing protein [Orbaceae bacterium ac157xtp]